MSELHSLGVKMDSIFSMATNVNTVTKASVDLTGGFFLQLSSSNNVTGGIINTRKLYYVSKTVPGIYLSEDACKVLGCIPNNFSRDHEIKFPVTLSVLLQRIKMGQRAKN